MMPLEMAIAATPCQAIVTLLAVQTASNVSFQLLGSSYSPGCKL
ncbi:hypothetical protein AVDCRST_MAG94-3524 [uncultured Leptolyngbya sp.]|uniref:Uncharacterized protein n=1 Tax=uncultured Leptolyngbya sp. TaxID=332963 RepID=A0A6J4MM84_9CYAN|nr:hypothetical protein AVDCRST_MAG94-3524 [uncultured Leptolyngbya sp.]